MRIFSERPRLPRWFSHEAGEHDPRIFTFNDERDAIVGQVVDRVVSRFAEDSAGLRQALFELAFEEIKRLERQGDEEAARNLRPLRDLGRRVGRATHQERCGLVRQEVARMAYDVAGNFDPRVYRFAARVVPELLATVLDPSSVPRRLIEGEQLSLSSLLSAEGNTEHVRKLIDRGVVVFVPTHSSNLDSIAIGQTLLSEGLPPAVYGAGKNLFTNPLISFFMHNLGAYRVDRRIKASLYKDVLKSYACVMVERGYHSLFFPGGTRSRSGMVERKLKLGLAGSAVEAFSRSCVAGARRRVFFVPITINYMLVLEAETLIEDFLTEAGRARYIIEDDEFSRADRWVSFLKKLTSVGGGCTIRFGPPLDPFGNLVDDEGRSLTAGDRTVDPSSYVKTNGVVVLDPARDAAYTRELGERIAEHYRRETVLMTTQLVAHVLFRALVRATPEMDPFARLGLRQDFELDDSDAIAEIGAVRQRLLEQEAADSVRLSERVRRGEPAELLDEALAAWHGYHRRVAASRRDARISIGDPSLLLYYQNRLAPFAEALADDKSARAARELSRLERLR